METNGPTTPPAARTPLTRQIFNYLWRATWLKCPVCGTQPMFISLGRTRSLHAWLTPLDGCPRCGYPYEREPGYFLMAVWAIGYIVAALFGVLVFVYLQIWHRDMPTWEMLVILAITVPLVNVVFARHSKAYWLAVDHLSDPYIPPSKIDGSEPDDEGNDDGGGNARLPTGPVNEPAGGSPDPAGQPGSGIEREREASERREDKARETAGVS